MLVAKLQTAFEVLLLTRNFFLPALDFFKSPLVLLLLRFGFAAFSTLPKFSIPFIQRVFSLRGKGEGSGRQYRGYYVFH